MTPPVPGHLASMSLAATLDAPTGTDDATRSVERCPLEFSAIYRQYFGFVWHNLHRLGVQEASVDDAAQDVFLVLHRRIGSFAADTPIKVWLFRTVLCVARDYRRWWRRKGGHDALHEALVDGAPGPHESAARAEATRLLSRVLDALDDDRRAVFVLAEVEQMTAQEIAAVLEINVNTVYSRLRAARADFNAALSRHQRRNGR